MTGTNVHRCKCTGGAIHFRQVTTQTSVNPARTIHQATANVAAVSESARPELITASTTLYPGVY